MKLDNRDRLVLRDFQEWSGGFTPGECTDELVQNYIDVALPDEIDGIVIDLVRAADMLEYVSLFGDE